jgi:hypothetical protein
VTGQIAERSSSMARQLKQWLLTKYAIPLNRAYIQKDQIANQIMHNEKNHARMWRMGLSAT